MSTKSRERSAGVSVLMPARNSEKTILRAISSTLLSLDRNSELLICLDGSRDGTSEIVSAVKDSRVSFISSEESEGVALSLNKLLTLASKPYVARMDSDDVCFKGRFRRQLQFLTKNKADFVFGNSILFGNELKFLIPVPQFPLKLSSQQSKLALLVGCPFVHSTMFARRRALEELGGYRPLAAEDYDLWLRAAAAGMSLERSNCYEVFYRRHDSQISRQEHWKQRAHDEVGLLAEAKTLALRLGIEQLDEEPNLESFHRRALELIREDFGLSGIGLIRLAGLSKFFGI